MGKMMHIWTIREVCEESSKKASIQKELKDSCLVHLYRLVSMGIVDMDVAAESTELSEEEFEKNMKEAGYVPPTLQAFIENDDGSIDESASLENIKWGACRLMQYLLLVYMLNRELEQEKEEENGGGV